MQIPTHPEYVPVIYQSASERWDSTVILNTSDPVPLATLEGTETENVIRRTIATLTGIEQQVMSDLYRHLVLSNFTVLDGKGGRSAASDLDKKYPDHQTLPERKQKSGRVNTSGVIVSILLEGGEAHKKDAFSILGGILISLLRAGVLETPVLDAIASPAPQARRRTRVKCAGGMR